ncbi:MAG: hypothetical protein KC425_14390 [Anaerolineales bacterium]|nr:hypothetical protein [Anaerolineales bacterium]
MMRRLSVAMASGLLVGCASLDPWSQPPAAQRLQRDDTVGDCVRRFQASDILIDAAGTRDVQAVRVPGFPYLRVDRTLASLADEVDGQPQRAAEWSAALAAQDEAGRRVELHNAGRDAAAAAASMADCRRLLALADQQQLPALQEAAQVPDDYSNTRRVLGLYPLTRYAFAAGISAWQRDTRAEFAAALAGGPHGAPRTRYLAAEQLDELPDLRQAAALGLPPISRERLAALIIPHAPRLEIGTLDDNDRPGALVWQHDSGDSLQLGVDVDQAVLYVRSAHGRLGGRWLLQLVYSVWFPARPPAHAYDVLAGRLDGLLWRVTLDEDGAPLVYDSIHPCGCYHLFIPTGRVRARPQPESIDEGLFAPQSVRAPAVDERVVLHLATGTHYLHGVSVEPFRRRVGEGGILMALRDDDQLRRLPLPGGGSRSAFGTDGLVAGSERLERFYFWPTGIASAGQMRQWGRHATAFVGRRHFDDPTLLDRYFERQP